jgi:hypothetical protein
MPTHIRTRCFKIPSFAVKKTHDIGYNTVSDKRALCYISLKGRLAAHNGSATTKKILL